MIAAAVKAGQSGSLVTTDPLTGKQVKMFYTPVRAGDWGFVSVAPTSEILASAHSLRNTLILIAVILLLRSPASSRSSRPSSSSRRSGSDAAKQIATGDLEVAIDERLRR